jgi:hypothetical protein
MDKRWAKVKTRSTGLRTNRAGEQFPFGKQYNLLAWFVKIKSAPLGWRIQKYGSSNEVLFLCQEISKASTQCEAFSNLAGDLQIKKPRRKTGLWMFLLYS